jgi:hypothetical protein
MQWSILRTLFGTWFGRFLLAVGAIITYLAKGLFDNWIIGFANDQLLKVMKPFLPESFMAVGSWFWSLLIVALLLAGTVWATRKFGHVFNGSDAVGLHIGEKRAPDLVPVAPGESATPSGWLTPYEVIRYIVDQSEWGRGLAAHKASGAVDDDDNKVELSSEMIALNAMTERLEIGKIYAHGIPTLEDNHKAISASYWRSACLHPLAALYPGKCSTCAKPDSGHPPLYDDVRFVPDEVRTAWPKQCEGRGSLTCLIHEAFGPGSDSLV